MVTDDENIVNHKIAIPTSKVMLRTAIYHTCIFKPVKGAPIELKDKNYNPFYDKETLVKFYEENIFPYCTCLDTRLNPLGHQGYHNKDIQFYYGKCTVNDWAATIVR